MSDVRASPVGIEIHSDLNCMHDFTLQRKYRVLTRRVTWPRKKKSHVIVLGVSESQNAAQRSLSDENSTPFCS
jgi:hypothetical protein